jgi:hypothetical protein
MVYSRKKNLFVKFSDMIDGMPTLSGDFSLSAPHTLVAITCEATGSVGREDRVTVDLEEAFEKLPLSSD